MSELFGFSRTVIKQRYALLTPDGFVASSLPGWKNARAVVNISPAMGARFAQTQIDLAKDGSGEVNTGQREFFVYVLAGLGKLTFAKGTHALTTGSYAYLPPATEFHVKGDGEALAILIFEKVYEPQPGVAAPAAIVSHEHHVAGKPFLGNDDARLQVLIPDDPAHDMAVNIFTYQPGATLPFVETHIMEHGLLMLKGQGVYRLDADHFPVKAGDAIWMAPYCPQWFVAMGKTPASYIYYKDINRGPLP